MKTQLTESEVLEKWSHIAMKIFPPQTQIAPASSEDNVVCVRWRAEDDPDALSTRARGVDLVFSEETLNDYLSADAEAQLRHDAYIEAEIGERLHKFDPYKNDGAQPQIEKWPIRPSVPLVRESA